MNSDRPRVLNHVPEGRPAWLTYRQHVVLRQLTDAAFKEADHSSADTALQAFLTTVAGLELPDGLSHDDLHKTAFTLLRRGYAIEELSPAEYGALRIRFDTLEHADRDDMTLHAEGGHRRLYMYLTQRLGLDVEPGRGPVWQRAHDLIEAYEARRAAAGEAPRETADRLGREVRAMLDALLSSVPADARLQVAQIIAGHVSQAEVFASASDNSPA